MRRLARSLPLWSGVALLAFATAVAPASGDDGDNSGPGRGIEVTPADGLLPPAATELVATPSGPADGVGVGLATAPGQHKPRPANGDVTVGPTEANPAAAPAAPALVAGGEPVQGERVGVAPEGTVRVRTPGGAWAPLDASASVPNGTVVDATEGAITLTTVVDAAGTRQAATFKGATFSVAQPTGDHPIAKLTLRGGSFAGCAAGPRVNPWAAFAAKARKPVRRLFGSGHGRFRTQGRFAAATVRGTIWVTEDYCDRTVVLVQRGVVAVRDLHSGRSVDVRAGSSRTIRRR